MPEISKILRILFVYLAPPGTDKTEIAQNTVEVWNLIGSMGNAAITDLIVQKENPHPGTYIGPGKADEITAYLQTNTADIVMVNGILTPTQKFNLTKKFWAVRTDIRVWDRMDMILEIFSRHAGTREAKLQIDLARMRHMGPRIFGMGMILSRQAGGIGTRGIGETNTELMKRHWQRQTKLVRDALDALSHERRMRIDERKNRGIRSISLVGYTNAGKTTLFNRLTGKNHSTRDRLFETLDSAVSKLYLQPISREILISDTIGFIRDVPPGLIDAFKSTLMESVRSDLVIHVADMSDTGIWVKLSAVEAILHEIGVDPKSILLAWNKSDLVKPEIRKDILRQTSRKKSVVISAGTGEGIPQFLDTVSGFIGDLE